MPHIQVLDQITIDKIAAGEVIERPASIVKELVENAIDAGASMVTIEIEDGGVTFIRITDNGCGIAREDVRNAFLRHSTSKIKHVEDLATISSLGFRGEALSSIAAVTKVELVTKQKEDVFGTKYVIEGGKEISLEDTGASDGTIFLIRQLFYNVPARRKFLKTAMTEAGHVQDLLTRLALSHPEVGFRFLNNGQEKLRTSGNGKLKDVIYSIYGREIAANIDELHFEKDGVQIDGFIGNPSITRGNRNFETFFVNGRYVKSNMISKAAEDAYKDFKMQHRFPFFVLHFHVDGEKVDVNVHPTKMELRFQNQQAIYDAVYESIHRTLLGEELIPQVEVPEPIQIPAMESLQNSATESLQSPKKEPVKNSAMEPSPFLLKPKEAISKETEEVKDEDYFIRKMEERVRAFHNRSSSAEVRDKENIFRANTEKQEEKIHHAIRETNPYAATETKPIRKSFSRTIDSILPEVEKPKQLDLFEEKLLKREIKADYKLIGQVFDTYWLVEFQDNLYIIDQHAAHERVLYERTLKEMKNKEFTSQYLSPPMILTLNMQEENLLKTHMDRFTRLGFEIEHFGGEEYAIRAVPDNLFGIAKKELFIEMLDSLNDNVNSTMTTELIDEKVASMSCKAAVKGNNRLSAQEVDTLIGELLLLENPYHCPHGRPTIIAMSKRELEKKFKRIV